MFCNSGTINGSGQAVNQTVHFNNVALHAIAITLSVADNALLQLVASLNGSGKIGPRSRIETINHPLPRSLSTQTTDDGDAASLAGRRQDLLIPSEFVVYSLVQLCQEKFAEMFGWLILRRYSLAVVVAVIVCDHI